MRVMAAAIVAMLGLAVFAGPSDAALLITIDKAKQRMIVSRNDVPLYDWPVSTGQRGYDTPAGVFQPFRMEKDHFSREWDEAPMPYSIFFTKDGHAIHGSFDVKKLGRPASHGCVRLSPQHSAILWGLVREEKMANTRVVLTGTIPGGPGEPVAKRGVDPYGDDVYAVEALPSHWRGRDPRGNDFVGSYYPYERTTRGSGFNEFIRERRY
jgi:L,D-transpeptidase-like protein